MHSIDNKYIAYTCTFGLKIKHFSQRNTKNEKYCFFLFFRYFAKTEMKRVKYHWIDCLYAFPIKFWIVDSGGTVKSTSQCHKNCDFHLQTLKMSILSEKRPQKWHILVNFPPSVPKNRHSMTFNHMITYMILKVQSMDYQISQKSDLYTSMSRVQNFFYKNET